LLPLRQSVVRSDKRTNEGRRQKCRARRIHAAHTDIFQECARRLDRPDGLAIQPPPLAPQLLEFEISHKNDSIIKKASIAGTQLYTACDEKTMRTPLTSISIASSLAFAAPSASAEAEVRKTLSDFIQAFDNLDWDHFRAAFADGATVFYPREFPHRATGREEFERFFRKVFDRIRGDRTQGPFMDIQPRDLNLQIMGTVAIATFHLDDRSGFLNRRTIVLEKQPAGWKIIHLHASEVATPTN
jgi:ketosteroid isomerase-like protein